jgi:shikimate kinase
MSENKTITYETCNKCIAESGGALNTALNEKQQLREAAAREVYLKAQIKQLAERVQQLEKENAK